MNESVTTLLNEATKQYGTDYRLYVVSPSRVYVYEGWYEVSADLWIARFTFVDGAIEKAVRELPDEDEEQ